jgi:hypothetical protein
MMAVFSEFIEEIVEVFMDDFFRLWEDVHGLLGKLGKCPHQVCGGRLGIKLGKVPLHG